MQLASLHLLKNYCIILCAYQSTISVDSEMISEESNADKEMSWCIHNCWLFNADDKPSVGPNGPDEKDRVLVDEFHPKYILFYGSNMSMQQDVLYFPALFTSVILVILTRQPMMRNMIDRESACKKLTGTSCACYNLPS